MRISDWSSDVCSSDLSGRVVFPDGRVQRVGFAGSNGHPFYAIGRALIEEGIVSRQESSMQKIRDWLRANPEKGREVMQRNARYIFFRAIDGEGPIGAQENGRASCRERVGPYV